MHSMSPQDIGVDIIDGSTVRLENKIKADGLTYSWLIQSVINDTLVYNDEMLAKAENDVIEISYEQLCDISFQAIIEQEGTQYKSDTFLLQANGELRRSAISDGAVTPTDASIARDVGDIVSLAYLAFLLLTVLLYYLLPKRTQWMVLLFASSLFYLLSGVQYFVFIAFSSAVGFLLAKRMTANRQKQAAFLQNTTDASLKAIRKKQLQKQNRRLLFTALLGTLGVMAVIKYAAFFTQSINAWFSIELPLASFILPLGLSFYTFILLSYLIDVYRGKYAAEGNFFKLFLFVSFFPHVSQGPISRFDGLAAQFSKKHSFSFDNLCLCAQHILWGFFVKLVLADRIAIFVNSVYDSYEGQSWQMLLFATLAFSVQIYADFYGSMEIAIGSAQLFGIKLAENFMRPYFSTNMPEFWRRWHITLGAWFRDYVFYPISLSRPLMKFNVWARKKWGAGVSRVLLAAPPIMGVWVLTGLWHGASWNFAVWGLFHGLLILLSTAFSQPMQNTLRRLHIPTKSAAYALLQMAKVFLLCSVGRVFFRSESLSAAFNIFGRIMTFSPQSATADVVPHSLGLTDGIVLLVGLIMFLAVSITQERGGSVRTKIAGMSIAVRWGIWIVLILGTVLFGIYGPGTSPVFLYEDF